MYYLIYLMNLPSYLQTLMPPQALILRRWSNLGAFFRKESSSQEVRLERLLYISNCLTRFAISSQLLITIYHPYS